MLRVHTSVFRRTPRNGPNGAFISKGVPMQPLQMAMAKDVDTGEYLWNLELWHEKLVNPDLRT